MDINELVQRQQALLAKADRDDDEEKQLAEINKTLSELTATKKGGEFETLVKTMKLSEALDIVDREAAAITANPDPKRAALLRKNLDSLEAQEHNDDPDAVVAFEVAKEKDSSAEIAGLRAELAELRKAVETLSKGGEEPEAETEKAEKITIMLAKEMIDGFVAQIAALKARLDSGDKTLTREDVYKAFDNSWDVQSAVKSAITALVAKAAETDEKLEESDFEKAAELLTKADDEGKDDEEKDAKADDEKKKDGKADDKADVPTTCEACNAPMLGKSVCPKCGWKVGEAVPSDKKKSYDDLEKESGEGLWDGDLAPELDDVEVAGNEPNDLEDL